jgi:colanic acid biosynthesis glycosyl transferase WcaI
VGALKNPRLQAAAYKLEHWAYRSSSSISYVTEGVRSQLLQKGVPLNKLIPLPNGVNIERFRPSPVPQSRPIRFLYAGTIGLNHGADVLVHAAAQCAASGVPVELTFLGSGSDKDRLHDLAVELELETVTFHEPVPIAELPGWIDGHHVGVVSIRDMPTTRGGRPSKLFPFLASSRPILFSGAGEAAELISTSRCGVVVPNQITETSQAMTRLAGMSNDELDELGRAGRKLSLNYSWDSIVQTWSISAFGRPT